MIALALISMLSCRSSGLTAESADKGARRQASARSRGDAHSSLIVVVAATPGISSAIVRGALDETTAIWRAGGFTLEWHLSNGSSIASDPSTVHVILDDARGSVSGQDLPLGWINFNSYGVPEGIVHLSHRNVVQLIDATDAYRNRPTSYKELLVARALGRALAHELEKLVRTVRIRHRGKEQRPQRFAQRVI